MQIFKGDFPENIQALSVQLKESSWKGVAFLPEEILQSLEVQWFCVWFSVRDICFLGGDPSSTLKTGLKITPFSN